MAYQVELTWKKGMAFNIGVDEHLLIVDSEKEFGGEGQGPGPKPLMLAALAGCTAMDVVSLLDKMEVPFDHFDIAVEAEQTDEHPRIYKKVHIIYRLQGPELDQEKIEKAIVLSQEKYCGVAAMFRAFATVTYTIELN